MNNDEFKTWVRYHNSAFPGVRKWLESNPETVEHWENAVAGLSIQEARRSTDALLRGDDVPYGWGEHPAAINRLAAQARQHTPQGPRFIDGREVFDCKTGCGDSGWLTVFRPEEMERVRRGEVRPAKQMQTCAVACDCQEGEARANPVQGGRKWRRVPMYDANKMVKVSGGIPNEQDAERLKEHIAALFDGLRTPEFDEWNE